MKYTKSILRILIAAFLFTSCEKNTSDIENEEITLSEFSEDLTQEDLTSAVATLSIKYPITAVNENSSKQTISSDEELSDYRKKSNRPKIEFPIEITVNEEIVTINSVKDLKEIIKKRAHRKPRLKLIFPVTVINADDTTTDIADKEAMKAYKETLAEGTRPTFQFPISIEQKNGTILKIESEEALKAHIKNKGGKKGKKQHAKRPFFKLVFPITVINANETTTDIADKEAMKTYKEALEQGVKPTFKFPISIEQKNGTILEIESEEALKTHVKTNKPKRK